jgi:hypothetical protein
MFSTFSAQGITDTFMHKYRVTLTFLATVSGACSASTLSSWLKGEAQLSDAKQKQLIDTIRALRTVSDSMPVPAAFRDPVLWRQIVAKYEWRGQGKPLRWDGEQFAPETEQETASRVLAEREQSERGIRPDVLGGSTI